MHITPTEQRSFNGILFIGDPHVTSKRPGRRKDDYLASVLAKLEECAEICDDYGLLPVILGDLLHRSDDNNLRMLNRLMTVLKRFPVPPLTLEGNHDKEETSLTESDALYLLAQAGAVHVLETAGLVGTFDVAGQPVRLFAAPYGSAIPRSVPEGEGTAVLITHHDLAFDGAYPGSLPIDPVDGVMMVVNGHMHDTKPSVIAGATTWHNPGNIEPLSVDLAHHVPKVWLWSPGTGNGAELTGIELKHGTDLFDLTGLQVAPSDANAAVAALPSTSKFAALITEEAKADVDAERTDDASILHGDLTQIFGAGAISDATQQLLLGLLGQVRQDAMSL
ncbi:MULTISPECIES: metallophosphoesterase family protein [unclassified Variovorax]|uniref:metallophosphoesterase family protein n=1 Tax=unclassified Variovorax TaxID=663243 RepID=UPI00076CD3DF|nr:MULTISPECIES: metallophosphoesterase [unclassified Variovorax]KWT98343.1 hypothetical protein APY03_0478 [Variovorax sp. WDL1]PNG49997.1 3',5'-cyclic adenosine monophosphate phosphodiesterase CpdA [Variovorax sp. B2]PNG50869.1 3',5'-cyclic adenosine monophosphate phosphodiesterase CpdA [Variovorax sp. B4]VTU41622.1 hypothetical protein H6P1_00010 [Variovorax sp. PBL-H6]VTU44679.1 hypothetical protein SRS16P1_00893 [Variovorax sp. SRS16]